MTLRLALLLYRTSAGVWYGEETRQEGSAPKDGLLRAAKPRLAVTDDVGNFASLTRRVRLPISHPHPSLIKVWAHQSTHLPRFCSSSQLGLTGRLGGPSLLQQCLGHCDLLKFMSESITRKGVEQPSMQLLKTGSSKFSTAHPADVQVCCYCANSPQRWARYRRISDGCLYHGMSLTW